jgi:hypothetical protein
MASRRRFTERAANNLKIIALIRPCEKVLQKAVTPLTGCKRLFAKNS